MNAIYKKEMRLLLPMFCVTLAVITGMSWLLTGGDAAQGLVTLFGGRCALIAAASFGVEFQSRTMPQLLAQPVSRPRLWYEKMLILGAALLLAYLFLLLAVNFIINGEGKPGDLGQLAGIAGMMAFCAFCSAPAMTLIGRNFIGGVVFTIMFPFALVGAFLGVFAIIFYFLPDIKTSGENLIAPEQTSSFWYFIATRHPNIGLAIPCTIYCFVLYAIGWRNFREFQAVDGQSSELQIKLPRKIQPALGALVNRLLPAYSGPITSLIRKELQLNRLSYLLAALFLIFLPLMAIIWKLHPNDVTQGFFWAVFSTYVIAIPVVVGIMSMAEERSWGTVAWQMTLPASPRLQAFIKLFVSLSTTVILGIVLPCFMFEALKNLFHLDLPDFFTPPVWNIFLNLMLYVLCLAFIIFASSTSTNSVRAIVTAAGLMVAGGLAVGLGSHLTRDLYKLSLPPGWLGMWCDLLFRAGFALASLMAKVMSMVVSVSNGFGDSKNAILATLACIFIPIPTIWLLTFFNIQKAELKRSRWVAQAAGILAVIFIVSSIATCADLRYSAISMAPKTPKTQN